MQLYVVGKLINNKTGAWAFAGVFDDRDVAEAVCLDGRYFVGPTMLNERPPEGDSPWPDAYYPRVQPVSEEYES